MLKDPLQTIFEILNHAVREHPTLAPHISQLVHSSLCADTDADLLEWSARSYAAPAPSAVKHQVLLRNNLVDATWVETGTFYGDTAAFISKHAEFVHTTEPEPRLFQEAKLRFQNHSNVRVYNEISENFLPRLLPALSGNICFWLDGHYSAGLTFAGPNDTPLRQELSSIRENIERFNSVSILIDDVRLCGKHHQYGSYPSLSELVAFSDALRLDWHIEHDIFIAKSLQT